MLTLTDKERFAQELIELSKGQDDTLLYKMPKKPLTAYMFFVREVRPRCLTRADKEQGRHGYAEHPAA